MTWPIAFLLTQLTEITIGLFLWKEISKRKAALYIFCASAITHPIVWFVIPQIADEQQWSYHTYVLVAETYAYGVEILWYYILKAPRPILLSCAANTGSFLLGVLIHSIF